MERNPDWKDMAKYLAGECSDAEEAQLLAWIAADPTHRELLDTARQVWEATGEAKGRWNVDAAWAQLEPRLEDTPRRALVVQNRWLHSPRAAAGSTARWAIAAALGAVAAAGVLKVGVDRPGEPQAKRVVAQEFITDKGQRARIRLSDGTHLILAPGSRVEVAVDFGLSTREIRLSGEAYFDVTPDPSRPFIVIAGDAVTRVLGTEFNVRAVPYDSTIRVVVADGEVSFRAATREEDDTVVLRAGELGELQPGTSEVSTEKADLDHHLGWRTGRLAFDNTPLRQVAQEIERWYGVPVRVGEPTLASRRLTASFRDQPVDEVLAVIAMSLGLEYTRLGQTYVLFTKGKAPVLATR